jgi:hypothetical protein
MKASNARGGGFLASNLTVDTIQSIRQRLQFPNLHVDRQLQALVRLAVTEPMW